MNCWEYFYCNKIKECPAYPEHGTHCAMVQSTAYCDETMQTVSKKLVHCMQCGFRKSIHYDKKYKQFHLTPWIKISRKIKQILNKE
jgi:hypothetical protein